MKTESVGVTAAVSIEIAAEKGSPGAEIIDLLIGLLPEEHSSRYPIEILNKWTKCKGGRKSTVSIYDSRRETSYICDCFIGDLSKPRVDISKRQFLLNGDFYAKGAFQCGYDNVKINTSRFAGYSTERKISLGQQIIVEAIKRCGGYS